MKSFIIATATFAATASAQLSSVGTFVSNFSDLYQNSNFWEGVIIGMQNQYDSQGNLILASDTAQCQTYFTTFVAQYNSITNGVDAATFATNLALKGVPNSTNIGFYVSQFSTYQQLLIQGFDLYNNCSFDYYMMAFGANFQNIPGLLNVGTNLLFRSYSSSDTTLTDLETNLTAFVLAPTDTALMYNIGTSIGSFFAKFLSVKIPTASTTSIPYYQMASQFA